MVTLFFNGLLCLKAWPLINRYRAGLNFKGALPIVHGVTHDTDIQIYFQICYKTKFYLKRLSKVNYFKIWHLQEKNASCANIRLY